MRVEQSQDTATNSNESVKQTSQKGERVGAWSKGLFKRVYYTHTKYSNICLKGMTQKAFVKSWH